MFDVSQNKQINNPDISVLDKLRFIEIKCSELLEARNNLLMTDDYNTEKELKELENLLDRKRKNEKLQKKRIDEEQDKINRQLKSAKRIEKQKKVKVGSG